MPVASNPELCDGRPDADACALGVMTPLIAGIGRAIDRLRTLDMEDARLSGKLDLTRVGVFGHSFGGAQAAQFCAEDARRLIRARGRRSPAHTSLTFSDDGALLKSGMFRGLLRVTGVFTLPAAARWEVTFPELVASR
jgi:pimeloyl-ACP methyl ester carboxylesterase